MALLRSLSAEQERWEGSSEAFKSQMDTIVGDVLLSAAFLAYAGYFDQQVCFFLLVLIHLVMNKSVLQTFFHSFKQYRQNLFTTWCHHLQAAKILFRSDIARTEYLSNPDERLRWTAHALPSDDLCTENAIMLKVCCCILLFPHFTGSEHLLSPTFCRDSIGTH